MIVNIENRIATVTMTVEELGIIRYTLLQGCRDLRSLSIYTNSMKGGLAQSAKETADQAEDAMNELEKAVREWGNFSDR